MKHLLLSALLLAGLASGCKKEEEPAPDPLLGHWQSESMSYVEMDAKGQVTDPGATVPVEAKLEVTATTMQLTVGTGTSASVGAPVAYTRTGDTIILNGTPNANKVHYVRSLTANTFTYEIANVRADGSVFITRSPYHR